MVSPGRVVQGLILFSTVWGIVFLLYARPSLPVDVFYFLTFGWVLFVVDSALTFIRPRTSYYVGLFLALIALFATLSQPEHYALVQSGDTTATVILVLGSAAEVVLVAAVVWYIFSERKRDPWAWPGAESPA
jgi:hypothetical protein